MQQQEHAPRRRDSRLANALITFVLLFGLLGATLAQEVSPVYLPGWTYAVYAAVGALYFVPSLRARGLRSVVGVLCVAYLAAIALLFFIPLSSLQPFLRDLERVRPGMTVAQVQAIMRGYKRGTGWPVPSGPAPVVSGPDDVSSDVTYETSDEGELLLPNTLTFRHTDNSDWGVVSFRNGRVSKVEFLPD
jgi:hypothetical protein